MRLANLDGRAVVVVEAGAVDVGRASDGRFGPNLRSVYDDWEAFVAFAAGLEASTGESFDDSLLGPPVPEPRQVFAIGLNYRAHAAESGRDVPEVPATFTKFPGCLAGPWDDIILSGPTVDWEVELVAVIGARADRVAEADGWDHIAGLTVGQDISDRTLQFAAAGQFSMGKSYRTYGPTGPWLVTPDELADRDDIGLRCSLDDEVMQDDRTSDLVFSVPQLVAELSAVVTLFPGDIIFTGTPAGVGITRTPPRYLQVGEVLETTIDGIGTIRNTMVAP